MPIIGPGSSGSLYPNKSILTEQLGSSDYDKQGTEVGKTKTELSSKLLGEKKVEVWSGAAVDLGRLPKIILDERPVVDHSKSETDPAKHPSLKAEEVFDEILTRCDENVEMATAVADLFNQGLALNVRKELLIEKGCADRSENGYVSHHLSAKDKVYVLETNKDDFKVVEEHLYRKVPDQARDIDRESTYFKAKIIVSGKKTDLASRNVEKLDFKVAYTEETRSEQAAKKCNYIGTRAGGFSDRRSYIN